MYSTFNTNTIPHPTPSVDATISWPKDALACHFARNKYPFLPWISRSPRFIGPIFERLAIPDHRYPLEQNTELEYVLKKSVKDSWERLEIGLNYIGSRLLQHPSVKESVKSLPSEHRHFPSPSCFGYLKSSANKKQTICRIKSSQEAFVILMGDLSMLMHLASVSLETSELPEWARDLITWENVHPEWMKNLIYSELNDRSCPQYGAIIDIQTCRFLKLVPMMIERGIPVLFRWPRNKVLFLQEVKTLSSTVARYVDYGPREQDGDYIEEVLQRDLKRTKSILGLQPASNEYPEPFPGSRQLRGESWQQFFSRQEEIHKQMRRTESSEEIAERFKREKNRLETKRADKEIDVCFRWTKVNNMLMRRRIRTQDIELYWELFSVKQRKYDPFLQEWDLCVAFKPHDNEITTDGMDMTEFIDQLIVPAPADETIMSENIGRDKFLHCNNSTTDFYSYEDFVDLREEGREVVLKEVQDRFTEILYERYGFYFDAKRCKAIDEEPKYDMQTLRSILRERGLTCPEEIERPTLQFFSVLLKNGEENNPTAVVLSDLSPSNPRYIQDIPNTLQMSVFEISEKEELEPEVKRKARVEGREETGYVMKVASEEGHDDDDTDWHIFVTDPATVVQCIQKSFQRTSSIARYLLACGIQFSTVNVHKPNGMKMTPSPRKTDLLGYRGENHVFTAEDYKMYETRCRNLLLERGTRAAVMKGGIIQRLAIEIMGQDISNVLVGPSKDSEAQGLLLSDKNGYQLIDDVITEGECEILCGVYHVLTGEEQIEET